MNKDCLINDTFDNFSFSESGRFLNRSGNYKTFNSALHSSKLILPADITSKSVVTSHCDPIKQVIARTEPHINGNISVDDSIFLNEFFPAYEKKDSEELFTDTPKKSLNSNDFSSGTNDVISELNQNNLTSLENTLQNQSDVNSEGTIIKDDLQEPHVISVEHSESNNISVDDSVFLNQVISSCDKSICENNLNGSVKCSKGLITNAPERSPISYKNVQNNIEAQADKSENVTQTTSSNNSFLPNCDLSAWGLPDAILQKYAKRGITSMFEWQAKCLGNSTLLQNHSNLVYSAPTSAGKTLVAEILAIKTVMECRKKVLFILPFVSVVREKMFYFQDIVGNTGVRVEGFMGSHNPPGGFQAVQIAVCTIEKANGIINRLLEDGALGDIGAVIVDEMHLLGDSSRGYLLELMLTKLQYMTIRYDNVQIQIIGMSATLPNLDLLGKWLKAELFVTEFRPIPLYEQCLVNGEIYNKNLQLERRLPALPELETDTDNVLQLCLETIQNSCSVLIFCPTKNWCENLSQQIAMAFWKLGCSKSPFGCVLRKQLNCNLIGELLEQLKRCPVGLDKILQKTTSYGVAFHHAGLTMDERDIIEAAFRNGGLRVLVATSTLSSGVNLPARRVIIRTPMFHGKPLDSLVYRQMIGRAGRMGKDSCGESILVCQKTDHKTAKELLSAELQPIESCLEGAGRLKRAILEVVASGVAATPDDVRLFTNCTLLAASERENEDVLQSPIEEAVEFLCRNEFIRLQKLEDGNLKYIPTSLGKACLSSSMPPEEGLALFSELEKARQCFVLENELHLVYTVTPYSVCNQWGNLDWMLFLELWEKLPTSMKRVGELVGIRESYIINGTRNKIQSNTSKLYQKLQVHRRFFTALALQDLVNEVPLNDVAVKFGCARGMLQSLQQSAATFAGMLTIFSRQLGWSSMEILIAQFQDRLQFGISRDLLDLMRLPILNGPRARALYNAGIETLAHLASSDVCVIENVLHKVVPFMSEKERDGETEFDAHQRNKIRGIWVTGKEGLTEREAAVMLVHDARRYLQLELGLAEAKWEMDKSGNTALDQSNKSAEKIETNSQNDFLQKSSENGEQNAVEIKNYSNSTPDRNADNPEAQELNSSFELQLSPEALSESSNSLDIDNAALHFNKLDNRSSEGNVLDVKEVLVSNILSTSDQSLFEESFELNRQLASCTISAENSCLDEQRRAGNMAPEDNLSNNVNSCDSGLDFENGSFLENAFVSSFDIEPDISHDKIGDVIANSPETNMSIVKSEKPCNLVDGSKCGTNSVVSFGDFSSANFSKNVSIQMCRKRDRADKENICKSSLVDEDEFSFIEQTPTKKRKTHTFRRIENDTNVVLREHNGVSGQPESSISVDLTKFNIINVCNDKKLFETFCTELFEQSTISLSFACSRVVENKRLIGENILGKSVQGNTVSIQQFAHKDRHVAGLAVMWGSNTAYYVSFDNMAVIQNADKIEMLKKLFCDRGLKVRIFECKEQVKVANLCCDLDFYCVAEDPKVGDWLMEPEGKEKNLQAMALKYAPEAVSLSQLAGNCKGVGSVGLDLYSTIEPRIRAAVEAVVTWHLCKAVCDGLAQQNLKLLQTYKIEMSSILCLARMELNGLGVNMVQLQSLVDNLKEQIGSLERQAYSLAGRHFSFTSSTDVAKVLGIYRGRKVSTNKQTLEQQDHPVAKLVLQWRKLSSTLTKMMYPLILSVQSDRIHGCCVTHSSTGRISMHEPNLQNIPRDFEVESSAANCNSAIKCRMAFVPGNNYVFLSADYCQLELRVLAHLSQDSLLCSIMRSDQDVFKSVAAKWKNIEETEVDDMLRQWAKRLCYGIIYGMGTKALAEQLSVSEEDALKYSESFQARYPSIKTYVAETVYKCRDLGYVETLSSRRRYLSHINHQNPAIKAQAERQAVNTTVQGSAADIAKTAMVLIESRFQSKFRHTKNLPKLVLHLHDELLYEVQEKYLTKTAKILKQTMEEAQTLSVPLPIKLKTGPSWGTMKELIL